MASTRCGGILRLGGESGTQPLASLYITVIYDQINILVLLDVLAYRYRLVVLDVSYN